MFTSQQPRSRRAFTLVDLSMAIAVSGLILTATLTFTVYAARSFAAMHNYVDLEQRSQAAIDSMLKDIRETQSLSTYGTRTLNGRTITNSLTFFETGLTAGLTNTVTFQFTNNTLLRIRPTETKTLLMNVDYLTFQIFQRNPIAGSFDQVATTVDKCKLVSVSWICSRTIIGSKLNTESVQTAKIVIRKQ